MEINDALTVATDVAKTAKEVLPQTTEQTDGAIATLVGWFNNVVLYPVKKANITYRYKLERFEDDLYARTAKIPSECLHNPNLMIAGPTLEALKYTYDEEKLREMYVNLLASSMDSRMDKNVHPSYVQVIQQMNSFDATLFSYLVTKHSYIKAINPNVKIKGTNQVYSNAMPEWYIAWDDKMDIFQVSASLVRLSKLGLIELMFDRTAGVEGYSDLENSSALHEIVRFYQAAHPENELELSAMHSILYVNDYGKQFAKVCLN